VSEGRWRTALAIPFHAGRPTPRAANVIPTLRRRKSSFSTTVNGDGDIVITWSAENARLTASIQDDLNAPPGQTERVTASSPVASHRRSHWRRFPTFYRIRLGAGNPLNGQANASAVGEPQPPPSPQYCYGGRVAAPVGAPPTGLRVRRVRRTLHARRVCSPR